MFKLAVIRFEAFFADVDGLLKDVINEIENSKSNYKKVIPSTIKSIRQKFRVLESSDAFDSFGLEATIKSRLWEETKSILYSKSKQIVSKGYSSNVNEAIDDMRHDNTCIIVICNSALKYNLAQAMCKDLKIKHICGNHILEIKDFQDLVSGHNAEPEECLYISSLPSELNNATDAGLYTVGVESPQDGKIKKAELIFETREEINWQELKFNFCSIHSNDEETL